MEKRKYFTTLGILTAIFSFVCLFLWELIPILLLLCIITFIAGILEKNTLAWGCILVMIVWLYSYQHQSKMQDREQEKIELIKE